MADNQAVWGIDIGQSGLKAIRLRYAEAAGQVIAVAFDYIPHAKILSQPDAVPDELIQTAISTFLSRNETKGDLIAISVPGQSALTRFIQLPPVESSRVDEIVKYEAKQQIPFALEDVIWDYQTLGGGIEESGFMLGAEVGLFAMKKEGIYSAIKPYVANKMEIELVQIAPLAMHNFLCFDQIGLRPGQELEGEGEYMIVLDMGTDNTTLLVTNGNKIWIRNVPIGGNHFTRALTKEMKLTFAKAEHLKCNATKAPDPRAVFQALRPVFNDYVSEIQRSIGYFSSVNREAKITKIVGAGNGFKLAGLQKFLQQNLQYEVERVDNFQALVGDAVLNAPLFQENVLSFVVPYGLALQALKLTRIHTTLLPSEIATARKIRRKKPWAVATAASLLFGLAMSTAGYSNVASSVSTAKFKTAEEKVNSLKSLESGYVKNFGDAKAANEKLKEAGDKLVTALDTREMWLEVYRAINECLPRDVGNDQDEPDITRKNRINLKSVSAKKYPDVSTWYNEIKAKPQVLETMIAPDREKPPAGAGYVFTLVCEHYRDDPNIGPDSDAKKSRGFVLATILRDLSKFEVTQPGSPQPVPVRKLGISHACAPLIKLWPKTVQYFPRGKKAKASGTGAAGGGTTKGFGGLPKATGGPVSAIPGKVDGTKKDGSEGDSRMIDRTDFTIQFAWVPTPVDKRPKDDPLKPATPVDPANPNNPPGTPASPPTAGAPVTNPAISTNGAAPMPPTGAAQ
jgi:type IV pilus assembly protein PilM